MSHHHLQQCLTVSPRAASQVWTKQLPPLTLGSAINDNCKWAMSANDRV